MANAFPELWIVAGPNGAGKTTCVQKEPISSILPGVAFLNPDDRTLFKLREIGFSGFVDAPVETQTRLFIESANEVFSELEAAVSSNIPVGVETVLSSAKYLPLVEKVVSNQGFVGLIYITLDSPSTAQQRVAARVKCGGHGIPDEKIKLRWYRSLEYFPQFAEKATAFWVIDNSNSDPGVPPVLIANGQLVKLSISVRTMPLQKSKQRYQNFRCRTVFPDNQRRAGFWRRCHRCTGYSPAKSHRPEQSSYRPSSSAA